jgi:hypothetical protein
VQAHVFAAHRLHADDTTVPVLAKLKTRTGRIWVYVRDEAPFGGQGPPGGVYYYSPDRGQEHPQAHLKNWTGILQSDAYSGYNPLSEHARPGGPVRHAFCWAHARRNLSWMFCGSDRGGQRAAVMYSLIATCRMNNVDPEAWLRDVLARLPEHPMKQLNELLPWNWKKHLPATPLNF